MNKFTEHTTKMIINKTRTETMGAVFYYIEHVEKIINLLDKLEVDLSTVKVIEDKHREHGCGGIVMEIEGVSHDVETLYAILESSGHYG